MYGIIYHYILMKLLVLCCCRIINGWMYKKVISNSDDHGEGIITHKPSS